MEAGHSDVVKGIDVVAHHLQRHDRFLGNGHVGCPGRNHQDCAFTVNLRIFLNNNGARPLMVFGLGSNPFHTLEVRGGTPGNQDVMVVPVHRFDDARDLIDRFTFAENHFRKALPKGSMVIDVGEAEILERQ